MDTDRHNGTDLREAWDRLLLLLIAEPREGWEAEYAALTDREVERLFEATEARDE